MKNTQLKDLYIQCDCGLEHIFFVPQDFEELDDGIYMSILAHQFYKRSFWHRFKHIWYTLIHGVPYLDQICLDYDKVKLLNKYLSNYIALTELSLKMKKQNKKGVK